MYHKHTQSSLVDRVKVSRIGVRANWSEIRNRIIGIISLQYDLHRVSCEMPQQLIEPIYPRLSVMKVNGCLSHYLSPPHVWINESRTVFAGIAPSFSV